VKLSGGDADRARLGFGCSALVGGRTRREALDLLEVVLDAGISHFDVARVYGTGDAEDYVGEFASRHRDEITIATKFGIDPLRRSALSGAAKRLARAGMRRSKRLLRLVRRHASSTVSRGLFTPEKARTSLDVSLGALRTDYVDAYLLHDCTAGDWGQEELQATLRALRREGKIASYGPATSFAEVRAILEAAAHEVPIVQFEADLFEPHALQLGAGTADTLRITHGCFRDALPTLRDLVARDPSIADAWSRRLDLDLHDPGELASLLLAVALRDNPGGVVLFSSGDPERIRRNASIARDRPYGRATLDEFAAILREARRSRPAQAS
jgi:D-threo-aldose 1-dehydrogenase